MIKRLLALILLGFISGIALSEQSAPSLQRDGIAIKLLQEKDGMNVIIALTQKSALPKFEGVRFYTYYIPFGTRPSRIGYVVTDSNKHYSPPVGTVILHDRKYQYTEAGTDRQENGALTVERVGDSSDKYQLRGVYSYFSELYVIDEVVGVNQPKLFSSITEVTP